MSSLSDPIALAVFLSVFCVRCSYLFRRDRNLVNKARLCHMAVTVLHGCGCFRQRRLFRTAVSHVTMTILHAKVQSIHFCTRQSNANTVLSAKGRSVSFCVRRYNTQFVLSVRRRSIRFACGNVVPSLCCSGEDGEPVFARPKLSFCYG